MTSKMYCDSCGEEITPGPYQSFKLDFASMDAHRKEAGTPHTLHIDLCFNCGVRMRQFIAMGFPSKSPVAGWVKDKSVVILLKDIEKI